MKTNIQDGRRPIPPPLCPTQKKTPYPRGIVFQGHLKSNISDILSVQSERDLQGRK